VAGHLPAADRLGLVYFDLHPDLNLPGRGTRRPGSLDWMGVAHMLGESGGVDALIGMGAHAPMLRPDQVLYFAYGPEQTTASEHEVFARLGLEGITVDEVAERPDAAAARALALIDTRFDRILIHFDVDVIDFTDAPLSEHTGRNEGLAFDTALAALSALVRSPKFAALTVTELNPDHGEENGATLRRFVGALCRSLAGAPALA
jgi:arginase